MTERFKLPTTLATKPCADAQDPDIDSSIMVLVPGEDIKKKGEDRVEKPEEKVVEKPEEKVAEKPLTKPLNQLNAKKPAIKPAKK